MFGLKNRKISVVTPPTFFERPEHGWIEETPWAKRFFDQFFSLWDDEKERQKVKSSIIFHRPLGDFAYSISADKQSDHVILILDKLSDLMKSGQKARAMAILAHEVGHFILGHHRGNKDYMKKQIEADQYAADLGLGKELSDVLAEVLWPEARVRNSYLTSYILTQSH